MKIHDDDDYNDDYDDNDNVIFVDIPKHVHTLLKMEHGL